MTEKFLRQAIELASRNYTVEVSKDRSTLGISVYMAKNPELYGCMAQGVTIEEAVDNLRDARIDYIYSLLKDRLEVPDPAVLATQTTANSVTIREFRVEKGTTVENPLEAIVQSGQREQLYEAYLRT